MRRALITGAGRGLGRSLALAFAKSGVVVAVSDRELDLATQVASEIPRSIAVRLDVTDDASIQSARARLTAELGPIDVLVNNAGLVHGGPFLDVPIARHRLTTAVNLDGLVAVTHAFLPDLLTRPAPSVVNIASASAFICLPYGTTYCASKAAVLAFSDSLREEMQMLGHRHVHVLAVCPSFIDTGLFAGAKPPAGSPMLTADAVAAQVVRAVNRRRDLMVAPFSARLLWGVCGGLPRPIQRWICRRLGVSTSMIDWKGRNEPV